MTANEQMMLDENVWYATLLKVGLSQASDEIECEKRPRF